MTFTDNPFEREMKEPPRMEEAAPAAPPAGCRCVGCPYWRGIMCLSCYRDLLDLGGR